MKSERAKETLNDDEARTKNVGWIQRGSAELAVYLAEQDAYAYGHRRAELEFNRGWNRGLLLGLILGVIAAVFGILI